MAVYFWFYYVNLNNLNDI